MSSRLDARDVGGSLPDADIARIEIGVDAVIVGIRIGRGAAELRDASGTRGDAKRRPSSPSASVALKLYLLCVAPRLNAGLTEIHMRALNAESGIVHATR